MSNYHISKDDKGWKATRAGANKASARATTKAEIQTRAKQLATNSGGGEVREHASREGSVHKKGQIIDSDTHGKPDPHGKWVRLPFARWLQTLTAEWCRGLS